MRVNLYMVIEVGERPGPYDRSWGDVMLLCRNGLQEDKTGFVLSAELYDRYVKYCRDKNIDPVNHLAFSSRVQRLTGLRSSVKKIGGVARRGWAGVTISV